MVRPQRHQLPGLCVCVWAHVWRWAQPFGWPGLLRWGTWYDLNGTSFLVGLRALAVLLGLLRMNMAAASLGALWGGPAGRHEGGAVCWPCGGAAALSQSTDVQSQPPGPLGLAHAVTHSPSPLFGCRWRCVASPRTRWQLR